MKIPQHIVNQASYTNLILFCESKSIPLKREGKEYILKNNDSLYISSAEPYKWYRHSTGQGGKAIDFCTRFLGMTFQQAVCELTGFIPPSDYQPEKYTPTPYRLELCSNQKRVIAYLSRKRCIDYQIIKHLISAGSLAQDTYGNCAFIIKDFNGVQISAELHGTGYQRFKGQATKQDGFGFTLLMGEIIQTLAIFESAIDLVSFYQMYIGKVSDALLVSMGGLKSSVVETYRKYYPTAQVVLCVDNDPAGKDFARQYRFKHIIIADCKDWNEKLCQLEKKSDNCAY